MALIYYFTGQLYDLFSFCYKESLCIKDINQVSFYVFKSKSIAKTFPGDFLWDTIRHGRSFVSLFFYKVHSEGYLRKNFLKLLWGHFVLFVVDKLCRHINKNYSWDTLCICTPTWKKDTDQNVLPVIFQNSCQT